MASAASIRDLWNEVPQLSIPQLPLPAIAWRPTLRAVLLLLLAIYLLLGPARLEADVVAAVLGWSIVVFILALNIIAIIFGSKLRRSWRLTLAAIQAAEPSERVQLITPKAPAKIILKAAPLKLPPLYQLNLMLRPAPCRLPATSHTILGRTLKPIFIKQDLKFPHRGDWRITGTHCTLVDRFGLSRYRWVQPLAESVRVHPPMEYDSPFPIIHSCRREGDAQIDLHNRRGDPFDLKPYHPADGVQKILWKVYAKTGTLISRHPEAAMTPEGRIAVYCAADRSEDAACSAAIAYIKKISEAGLVMLCGCDGLGEREPANDIASAEELMIESVWEADSTRMDHAAVEKLLEAHSQLGGAPIDKMPIFVALRRLNSAAGMKGLVAIGDLLHSQGIAPVFMICRGGVDVILPTGGRPARSSILSWFLEPTEERHGAALFYNDFVAVCGARNWETIISSQ